MKKISFLVLILAVAGLSAYTIIDDGNWKNDPPHSQLAFTVTHLGLNEVTGTFNDFEVNIRAAKPDFSDAVVSFSAKVNSIDTRVEARNNHLKSPDFFDVEKFPSISFSSTGIKPAGKQQYKLSGNLTMHGITKPVVVNLVYKGQTTNPMSSKLTAAFQVTGTIKRSDFGIGEKFPSAMISDEVRIKADGEFLQQEK